MTQNQTVLVVDDDETIVTLLRDFLEADGYRVEGALDAERAQELLGQTRVDCLLLDIMMPGQSGFDLCREVRRTSDTPVLFLSARGEDADKVRGFGLGADDYIVKSASPIEVVARVKAVLRRSAAASPRREAALRAGRLSSTNAHTRRGSTESRSRSARESSKSSRFWLSTPARCLPTSSFSSASGMGSATPHGDGTHGPAADKARRIRRAPVRSSTSGVSATGSRRRSVRALTVRQWMLVGLVIFAVAAAESIT